MSLDNCQKSIIEQLTNKFEYDQLNFQFDFCKNINDGRGYTAGIVGFTTGTQDAYAVVKEYNELDGHTNEFQNYTTRLSQLASSSRTNGDTNGLQGFCLAWHTASANSVFRQVQINKMNQFYYNTALSKAQSAGLVNPSSIGQFYDAAIQHGVEGDDGLQDMISRTKATPPSQGGDEIQFIKTFMDTRKQIL
ncbi:lysozyme-like domain-containing protein, partial [Gorgonomyces haynaldii]